MIKMDVIKAPTKIEHPVYKAEFKYTPAPGVKGIEGIEDTYPFLKRYYELRRPGVKRTGGLDDTEIQKRLTGNIMEVGEPERWNLKELCNRKGIKLPDKIEMLCDEYDFWLIQSSLTFMPAHDNQFDWARIVAKMEPLSESMKNPIAYDAYPRNIYQERKEKHRVGIGFSLKFAEIIGVNGEYVQEIEFTRLVPAITVAGIGKSEPTWDFRDRAAFNLKDVNALYVIMKTPIKSEGIKLSYFSYAQIHTKWGGIIPTKARPLKGKEETYEIKF
jgi:hypothetical protein